METQLLCTFCDETELEETLFHIASQYEIAFNAIYVLQNVDESTSLCCTYNIDLGAAVGADIPANTISLHRKKATNTLYTINALNLLVSDLNGGRPDKGFKVPWENYRNTILVSAYNKLKRINTKLYRIVKVDPLTHEPKL